MDQSGVAARPSYGASRRDWARLVVLVLLTITPAVLLRPAIVPQLYRAFAPKKVAFDPRPIDALRSADPDYLFLGNSMLETRIDESYLNQLSKSERAYILKSSGSASAQWYLMLKNFVVPSAVSPRAVFIFFRDNYLTLPRMRVNGQYARGTQRYSQEVEPEFDYIVRQNCGQQVSLKKRIVESLFPLTTIGSEVKESLRGWVQEALALRQIDVRQINQMFSLKNLRRLTAADDAQLSVKDEEFPSFQEQRECSFLDPIVRIAEAHALPLVFVRVQRRPTESGPLQDSPELAAYIRDLRHFLVDEHGFQFHDFTGHPALTLDYYGDGDHIAPKRKREYTAIFAQELAEVLGK